MRIIKSILFVLLLLQVSGLNAQDTFNQGDIVYVKEIEENLRLTPNGTVITQLPQASKVMVLGVEGNWVAVQVAGWIWKPSLVSSKLDIKGLYMKALHIMVETESEANEIKSLLDKGSDFSALAKERSKGPNAQKGGDLGVVNKGDLLPELDNALRSLKTGEISKVVKSPIGYHIFKRTE
ncbi:MAG: peptidylprolyl isomerase [candidate division KSB1 bacterium]|jgi:hypothetical protein|nr:peptidylprolyl isomerase [candidate division KSB1 bacterium]